MGKKRKKDDDPLSHIKCGDCGRGPMDLLGVRSDTIDKPGYCQTCGHIRKR